MPNVPEDTGSRQTFGNAPGWGGGVSETPPVPRPEAPEPVVDPVPDAPAESSPATPVPAPDSQPGSAPSTPPVEERAFHMPPQERWDEVRKQREDAERRAQQAEQLAQLALSKLQTPQAAPQEDPWAGLVNHPDPATAQFYQQQQRLFQHEARKVSDVQSQSVLQAVDAGRRELAAIKIASFRRENPEIAQGSAEESAIAGYVQQGLDLETAKKVVLYDKLETENRALKGKQSSVPRKVAAAQPDTSAGIPAGAGLPPRQGDWRERAGSKIDQGGSFRDIANAIFGEPK